MAGISAAASPLVLSIDLTKQAEYPVVLGDRLAGNKGVNQSRLINIQCNYKTKSATPHQQSTIRRSSKSRDAYDLTITDKAPTAEHNPLTYTYEGSVDPEQPASDAEARNLVLVFDPNRKVFVLEPIATQLNFNLRSAPAKTTRQVREQYEQLNTLLEDGNGSSDDQTRDDSTENGTTPDESNPYDYRHFLPKAVSRDEKPASVTSTPEPSRNTSKSATTATARSTKAESAAAKKTSTGTARSKPQTKTKTPSTQQSKPRKSAAPPAKSKVDSPSKANSEKKRPAVDGTDSLSSDAATTGPSQQADQSPASNVIIDGDLIIDMGSPPPSRPAFKVNPAHFSSSNTPSNGVHNGGDGVDEEDEEKEEEDDDEEMEDLKLPSPVNGVGHQDPEDEGGQDLLAADMEAAFEQSALEEQEGGQQNQQPQPQQSSDDESEVSEEE